jgi:cation:H+ antiporter
MRASGGPVMAGWVWVVLFTAGVVVSLSASWQLVVRLERLGERAGFSEASLGLVAALAADAPEITAAATALIRGQSSVGAGVVIGSNVFNLAALLGLAAVVAGRIGFHRRVVLLGGIPGLWVAVACLLTVAGALSPAGGLMLAAMLLVPYAGLLALRRQRIARLPLPGGWTAWLVSAVHEEETELSEMIRPSEGTWWDGLAAAAALIAVVAASVTMEWAATLLGHRYAVADIITGALVLAVVTSLPNAVTAVYLARRGRGAAVLSTALNSNAINVTAGLLIPASLAGLGAATGQDLLVAAWYAGLTVLALALAYHGHGLGRLPGAVIIAGYLAFVAALGVTVAQHGVRPTAAIVPAAVIAVSAAALLAWPGRRPWRGALAGRPAWWQRESLLSGWSTGRLWAVSLLACLVIAACDAASGPHLILIGLLICGPCCALLTARWQLTAACAGLAVALGIVLGVPDQIFATATQYAFVAAVAAAGTVSTAVAAVLQRQNR